MRWLWLKKDLAVDERIQQRKQVKMQTERNKVNNGCERGDLDEEY
jgi:hypothetical protein